MLVTVSGHHVDVTPAMKEHAYAKADKLARFFGAKEAVVTLKVERERQIAEFIVYAPKHHQLMSSADHPDMYAAIDIAAEKMERQMRKLKGKWSDHHAREGREAEEAASPLAPPIDTEDEGEEMEEAEE